MKFIKIFLICLLAVVFTGCGNPFIKPSPLVFRSNIYGGLSSDSYTAFERTLYPITRSRCISCHQSSTQPLHASANLQVAHDAIISGFKVNFANIPSSRMVAKLRENHNCWSNCEDNALEIQKAIEDWNRSIQGTDHLGNGLPGHVLTPQSIIIGSQLYSGLNSAGNNLSAHTDYASLTNPMVRVNDIQGNYIYRPNSHNSVLEENANGAGIANISLQVNQSSGNYRVWALVDAPNTNDNGFYISFPSVNNSPVRSWEIPVTNGFEWRRLNDAGGNPRTFNLPAGNQTIRIRERKDGTKVKMVVVTSNNNFAPGAANNFLYTTLEYDLSSVLNIVNVKFKIDVAEYDQFSYIFSNPRIETSTSNIMVKGIKLLMNNQYNPQNSTFNMVHAIATPSTSAVAGYSMVVLRDKGLKEDKISFGFEQLQVTDLETIPEEVDPNEETNVDPAVSLASFTTTVYPISRGNTCINCHDTGGIAPVHASDSAQLAHDDILLQNSVNFSNPANSRLVRRMLIDRHQCGGVANCDNLGNQFEAAIIQWKNAREP